MSHREYRHQNPLSRVGNEHGVTLIEMLVYLVISGMLLAVAVTTFLGQNASYNRQDVVAEIQQNLRGAIEQMTSDIRFAGANLPDNDTPFAFPLDGSQDLLINIDSDLDEVWEVPNPDDDTVFEPLMGEAKTIHYALFPDLNGDPRYLRRGYKKLGSPDPVNNWTTIADNIVSLRFEYLLDSDWLWHPPPIADLEEIKAVRITISGGPRKIDVDGVTRKTISRKDAGDPERADYSRTVSVVVQCRNNRG